MALKEKLLLAIKPYEEIVTEYLQGLCGKRCYRGTEESPFAPQKTIGKKKITNLEAHFFLDNVFFFNLNGMLRKDFLRVSFDVTKPSLFAKPEVNGMHMYYGILYCPLVRNDPVALKHKFYRINSVIEGTGFSFEVMPIEETLKYKVIGDQLRSDVSSGTRGYVIFVHASISNIRCSYHKGEPEKNEATPEEAKAFLKQVFCGRILANMKKAVEESLP